MKKALVTGANGFIGSHLCDYLLTKDVEVIGLVGPSGDVSKLAKSIESPAFCYEQIKLDDTSSLRNAMQGVDVVFHVAALAKDWGKREWYQRANVDATQEVITASEQAEVGRIIFISSVSIFQYTGFRHANAQQMTPDSNISHYAVSKRQGEALVQASQLDSCIVRPGLFPFGTRDNNFERLAQAIKQGVLPLVNQGKAVINTVYIENLLEGIYLTAIEPKAIGNSYVIADEGMPSWSELTGYIAELSSVAKARISLPSQVSHFLGYLQDYWEFALPNIEPPMTHYRSQLMTHDIHFSIANAKEDLGYAPKLSWQEGIERSLGKY